MSAANGSEDGSDDGSGGEQPHQHGGFLFNGVPLLQQEEEEEDDEYQGHYDNEEEEEEDRVNIMQSRDESYKDYEQEDEEEGDDDYGYADEKDNASRGAGAEAAAGNGLFANMGFLPPGEGANYRASDGAEDEGEDDNGDGGIKFTYGAFDFQGDGSGAAGGGFDSAASEEDEEARNKARIEAPKMPETFYEDVNAFLSRGPPVVGSGQPPAAKKPTKKASSSSSLGSGAQASAMAASAGKPKSLKSKIKQIEKQRHFDESLLREAFDYAEKLNRETAAASELLMAREEASSHSNREASHGKHLTTVMSAPVLGVAKSKQSLAAADPYAQAVKASGGKKSKKEKGGPAGMVGRLRSKTAGDSGSSSGDRAFSNLSGSSLDVLQQQQSRRSGLDIDSLVQNFERGTLLNQLREELAASKQSLQDSSAYMKQMSKDFISKRK